jgi:hypothetical protein
MRDVGMAQASGEPGFIHEHIYKLWGIREMRKDPFDGDEAAKPFRATLNCKKYLRHTTAGDSLDQLIVTKGDTRIHIDESRSK